MKKLAILGASFAQRSLYEKAKELGIYVVGISWQDGSECADMADVFYPISISEMDMVVDCCKKECVDGVVSNCSEYAVRVVAYVAEKLGLDGTPYETILKIQNKYLTRKLSNEVLGLATIRSYLYDGRRPYLYPCVVKPLVGSAKSGVSYVSCDEQFDDAILYARKTGFEQVVVEEYVGGREVSVETVSFRGEHFVIQITDKESSGAPHFVELGHHQPSSLPNYILNNINKVVPLLLEKIGFVTGACHIEMKVNGDGRLYLIEINPRGGGDYISEKLTPMSTGYDYIASIILSAMGELECPLLQNKAYSGIYFLTKQTQNRVPFFKSTVVRKWLTEKNIISWNLEECCSNNYKNGYLIYKSDREVLVNLSDRHSWDRLKDEIGGSMWLPKCFDVSKQTLLKNIHNVDELVGREGQLLSTCRSVFKLIAKKHNAGVRKIVLVPSFTCHTQIDVFEEEGFCVKPYQINENLQIDWPILDKMVEEDMPAIVLIHSYFGFPIDALDMHVNCYKTKGVIVIEDRTQAILSNITVSSANYVCGSVRKWFPIPDGAFVAGLIIEKQLQENNDLVLAKMKAYELKGAYLAGESIDKGCLLQKLNEAESIVDKGSSVYRMSDKSLSILECFDFEEDKRQRRNNYMTLLKGFKEFSGIDVVFKELPDNVVPFMFPVIVENRKILQGYLAERGIYASRLWDVPRSFLDILSKEQLVLFDKILCFTIDLPYREQDMIRIIETLRDFCGK